jgi:hypothetical protein
MKKALFLLAAATLVLSFASNGAKAAPAAAGIVNDAPHVILVAEGCGRGFHRGPMGGCQRNLSPAWPCWWVRGPFGRWRLVCH